MLTPTAAKVASLSFARKGWIGSLVALGAAALGCGATVSLGAAEPPPGAAILQDLRSFGTTGTVLHVAAHPDDENTALITYFARGRGYRTAYLSLTRGDGGQNEIGPEFDEKLGVARTQELLAARKLDGGRQFFTRAIDFGFSKTAEETLKFWDRDQVLGDVVRVIRTFRPDVVITRFSPGSSGSTHGHHTASGILGIEATKLAGDPNAYPEQLAQGLAVWQPKLVVLNGGGFGRGGGSTAADASTVKVDIGGDDPVSGVPFAVIASRSRGMHITQGFGNFGRGTGGGPNEQSFIHMGGEPAKKDLMDGIDTTWARFPGGAAIGEMTAKAIAEFKGDRPSASVPSLLAIRAKLAGLPKDPVIDDKRAQLDRIVQACLGLLVETISTQPEVAPGETLMVSAKAKATAGVPVKWVQLKSPFAPAASFTPGELGAEVVTKTVTLAVPANVAVTQPYWLREEGSSGIQRVDDPKLIGLPENPAVFPIEYVFEIGGQMLTVTDEPVAITKGAKGERRRRVDVVSPVSLSFEADVSLVRPGSSRAVIVEVAALRSNTSGSLRLDVPAGWKVEPAAQPFKTAVAGEKAKFTFNVTAPAQPTGGRVTASAEVDGKRYSHQRVEIDYAHLPLMLLQPPARARLLGADVAIRGKSVGYLPGAGDDTAEALEQLGYKVTTLTGADLKAEKLAGLDAVLIGVRAFNERKDLAPNLPALWKYVEDGGTVIAQYNRPSGSLPPLGPYALSIAGNAPQLRVTDENAPVVFLAPAHPALSTPNKITPADFGGWIQERGAYFPSKWDEARYEPILAMSDPGEDPLKSAVLVAKHGKGYYVYTGLAFFRQLPAGVPGAYRLFANLVSLGHE
jgi:LmbE family N-acetylglucosaminyl deacetylase